MTEPTATDPLSTRPLAEAAEASAGTSPRTPAAQGRWAERPWARERSHVRALGATVALLGLWAALSLAAPLLAEPISDVAQQVRRVTGLDQVRPAAADAETK